ncbi:MAG: aspartate aminotransferase family protein [Alphaproteobacteria bacterium]
MVSALLSTYMPADLAFERGEGAYLFGTDGRRYLDFAAGIAVNALGHSHPKLVAALTEQGSKLWHCSNLYRIPGQERVAERLVANSFADRAFFCNSGAEAVECGIKMIRKYYDDTGQPHRYRIICCNNGFHGRTMATISAGGQDKHTKGFEPLLDGFDHVAFGNLNELRAAVGSETAAILVEPIQGEGGVVVADADYMRGLRAVADEFGLLLFYDEVQCGMGRTGRLFAHEWAGVAPDVMALAKGLGSGFPIGACLATERAATGITPGSHGSTFGGNPLAMAVANAVLDVMLADGFLENVRRTGALLKRELQRIAAQYPQIIQGVRGVGLMLGLECVVPNAVLQARLREAGLLTAGAGNNVIRVLPPLVIGEQQALEACGILESVCADWRSRGDGQG